MTSQQKQEYHEQGYIILRQALSSKRIDGLTRVVETLISNARQGKVKMKWADPDKVMPDGRVVSLLNPHSKWKVYDPYYVTWLKEDILPLMAFLLEGDSRCTLLSILFHGEGKVRVREGYHRDHTGNTPEEIAQYAKSYCSFQTPLKPNDNCHYLVPGTHNRVLTEEEERIRKSHNLPMPNKVRISLSPGDVLFRHTKILHNGDNPDGRERWTFIGDYKKS